MEPQADAVALRVTRRRAQADEWALVLTAEGLHPLLGGGHDGYTLLLPAEEVERAETTLRLWQAENRTSPRPPPRPAVDPHPIEHALLLALVLLVFFGVTGPAGHPASVWGERGAAEASRIRGAEPWRAVTALTLHADTAHVLGNAVAGSVFAAGVFRAFGAGVGGVLILTAGGVGNLANAYLRPGEHSSVGASTAVFGALGALAGLGLRTRRRERRGRSAWVPIGAALALLAMIGTEGERVDLWAHAFGLAAGVPIGVLAAQLPQPWLQRRSLQLGSGAIAIAGIAGSWLLALG